MTEVITSPQNKWIKTVAALKHKKYRDELGLFPVEGIRLVEELAHSDWSVETCLYTEEALQNGRVRSILTTLEEKGSKMLVTTLGIFDKLADTEQPQGIIAVAKKNIFTFSDIVAGNKNPLLVVLDTIQDPGNVGTAIRNADAAGCAGIVLTKGCADLFAGKTVRATMGSLFHIPFIDGMVTSDIISALRNRDISLFATSLEGSVEYVTANLSQAAAIVFGNEGNGVSDELLQKADVTIHIPLYGKAESLNVAASTAVILYEAARQRRL